jgi:hypothetical protein
MALQPKSGPGLPIPIHRNVKEAERILKYKHLSIELWYMSNVRGR